MKNIEPCEEKSRQENINKMSGPEAQKFIHGVVRLFQQLDIDKKLQKRIKQDIDSGDIYNYFHMYDIHNNNIFGAIRTIYQYYKR